MEYQHDESLLLNYKFLASNLTSIPIIQNFTHIVKSSATSSLITRDPEVKLSGLAQTEISRIDIEEVVWGAH
ncbi:hypothetical protein FOB78_05610 [Streptococcus agalactiae]|nr:hypothetical protein B8V46_09545 [Streptococcus agalactiae]QET53764.1 hypothetical protein FOB78_05610 [Streptococcus agalactiae]